MAFLSKLFNLGFRNEHATDLTRSSTPFVGQARHPYTVTITAYNTRWPQLFATEQQRLLKAFQQAKISQMTVAIEHIGSTSVPGLNAKPVVDLMIGVRDINDLRAFPVEVLTKLGYKLRPYKRPASDLIS